MACCGPWRRIFFYLDHSSLDPAVCLNRSDVRVVSCVAGSPARCEACRTAGRATFQQQLATHGTVGVSSTHYRLHPTTTTTHKIPFLNFHLPISVQWYEAPRPRTRFHSRGATPRYPVPLPGRIPGSDPALYRPAISNY